MRTSSQLRKVNQCEFNPNSSLTTVSPTVRDAGIQRRIALRALMGEPIQDLKLELEREYAKENKVWESGAQLSGALALQAGRLGRFLNWEIQSPERQNKKFLADLKAENGGPLVVKINGEDIEARPDYVVETDDEVIVCKIKTGRYNPNLSENVYTQEALALGLAGEKIADGKKVSLQYLYLGDSTEKDEKTSLTPAFGIPYDSDEKKYRHIIYTPFNDDLKEHIAEDFENTDHTCSPEDCAMCSYRNMCKFEEAPIPAPASDSVRPLGDVRLSQAQKDVIDFESGTARVNAGPGSGKTLVTSLHFASLAEKGYDPKKFCLLTFTNAGAGEMTARTIAYAAEKGHPIDPETLTSTTFNAFCQRIIEERYEQLGFTKKPHVIDESNKRAIINRMFDQFPRISFWKYTGSAATEKVYNKSSSSVAYVRAAMEFDEIKREGYTRQNYPSVWDRKYTPRDLDVLFMMYSEFNRQLLLHNYLEFDDQLKYVNKLYEMNPNLFEELGYEHIVVDEFQDTDKPQIELLLKMRDTTCFKSLMCVGDDSQSIFAFRHTSPEFMVNFETYFGRFVDFFLEENHRSNKATISFANSINDLAEVKVNKELIATKPEGLKPNALGFYSKKQEYEWIAQDIKHKWDNGERDIAVIMSDRNQLTSVASELTKLGVPSVLKSPVPLMSNSRINALVSFYDSFVGASSQGYADYQNILLHGGLKGASAAKIEEVANGFKSEVDTYERSKDVFLAFAKALDLEEHDEAYQEFLKRFDACEGMDDVKTTMENFKLYGKDEMFKREGRYEGVNLTTIHSAKGLEWDITYLCVDKLDDPKYHERLGYYTRSGEYDEQIRKFFVGATRAREELIITGEYLLKLDTRQQYAVFNEFLKKSFELTNRVWGYTYSEYEAVKAAEKAEANAQAIQNTLSHSRIGAAGREIARAESESQGIEIC